MNLPGFTADSSLFNIAKGYSAVGIPTALSDAGKLVPQQNLSCFLACQGAWSACVSGCQWWEWAIGSCIPKCRVSWFACVGRC